MSLPADSKLKLYSLGDVSGGVNLNDPAISLAENEVQGCLNVMFLKKGFKRWCGAENLTTKDAVADMFRGIFHHATIAGTQYLYGVWGGKVYSVNKATGAIGTAIYDLTGTGEAWGSSHWGNFYLANGAKCCKVEGTTAYQVGIAAPAAGTSGKAAGGTLPDGVYKISIGYARRVGGLNVLYSKGFALSDQTLGGGNNTITIASFANSADAQVGNKIVWMTDAGGATYYFYYETTDNTTTSFSITSAAAKNNAILYDTFAAPNALPGAFTYLYAFDNRLWGIIGNVLYYSQKATTSYDLEKFPTINRIEFPFQLTGIFSVGTLPHLYLNTADNGIMLLQNANVGARYEHLEQRESFSFMRTLADWNGGKIGLTKDKIGFFNGTNFEPWDYGYNIRPILNRVWANDTADFHPGGFTYRRDNRIEYALGLRDINLGTANNNRTYVLNLSQTFFQDSNTYKTPWEIIDRGFNYVAVDASNAPFYAQSFATSSQIFKETSIHSYQIGIRNAAGTYLTAADNMVAQVIYRTIIANMFTVMKIKEVRTLARIGSSSTLSTIIADDLSKNVSQTTDISSASQILWDVMIWDEGKWVNESQEMIRTRGKQGTSGYSWYFIFSQTADDINLIVTQFDILATLITGNNK